MTTVLPRSRRCWRWQWIDTGTNVGGEVTNTKYGNYTLPGGQNYREVLLTLPPKSSADPSRAEY